MEVPVGAELCLPSLSADLTGVLSLAVAPANVERPTVIRETRSTSARRTVGGRGQLEDMLSASVVGQRCVVDRLAKHPGFARLKMRGLWSEKPLVLLLTGPSGTGKTLMARTLGEALVGRPIAELESTGRFRTFHMNGFSLVEDQKSFFGPPKGIMGVGDLPELLKTWPDAVILLDECEKAHPSFARALLKVFGEHGAVYDPRTGRDISSVNATFILTSNLAKDLIFEHSAVAEMSPDSDLDCAAYGKLREDVLAALRAPFIRGRDNFFKESEVRGRLTDVLPFLPFGSADVDAAVTRFLSAESDVFRRSPEFLHASLAWEPGVVAFLASEYARRPEEGLRGVHTQLQAKVREVFEHAIESGLLERYGEVVLRVRPGTLASLDLRVVPASPVAPPSPAPSPEESIADKGSGNGDTSSWWPIANFTSPASWQVPSFSGGSGSAEWGTEHQWERLRDWDWELYWQQLREILWDYWPLLLVTGVAVLAAIAGPSLAVAASAPVAVPVFAAAAPAAASVSAPAAAAAAAASVGAVSAAPWVTAMLAGLQLVVPVGTTAVTAWMAAYVWQNRRLIAAIATLVGLLTLFLPTLLRMLCKRCRRRFAMHEEAPIYEFRRTVYRSPQASPRRRRRQPEPENPIEGGRGHDDSNTDGNTVVEESETFFSPEKPALI